MPPDEAPPYAELVRAWRALRASSDLSLREIACVRAPRTLLVAELVGEPGAPALWLSAGVHGDEPAGPWALLSIVRDGLLDRRYSYRIWPCTNPSGYELGTRANAEGDDVNRSFHRGGTTPEARAIITANRDRRFALALDLHEDFEATGFYCYEPTVAGVAPLATGMARALDDAGLPVQELDDRFELGYAAADAHLRALERGRVIPDTERETRAYARALPLSLFLMQRAARRTMTFESARSLPWPDRLAMHRVAVTVALERLRALGE